MTPQEAIEILRQMKKDCEVRAAKAFSGYIFELNDWDKYHCKKYSDASDALGMAISALEKQDVSEINVGDMISRQAAIEAIEKHIRTAEEPYQLTDADKVMNHAFEIAASCVYNLSVTEADVPDTNVGDMISRQAEPLELQFEQVGTHIIKTCPTCHTPWRVPPTSEYLKIAKYPCCPCGQRIRWERRDE